jgi:hypothetical protein
MSKFIELCLQLTSEELLWCCETEQTWRFQVLDRCETSHTSSCYFNDSLFWISLSCASSSREVSLTSFAGVSLNFQVMNSPNQILKAFVDPLSRFLLLK